ncbi:peptidase M20D family protein [Brochothrix thermosphacta DSM 20171 = FSL F6-1036]|nr:peptidase M20D family protein [Brochothrix thermosphacta DSM 20171 = FSL F6-1036]
MNLTDLQKIRRDLHQIPELGYEEFKTQAYLLDYLSQLPQANMVVKKWRTGLLVRISGTDSKKNDWLPCRYGWTSNR